MIICADDYGLSKAVNLAIEELCEHRKISAVSIICTEHSELQTADVLKRIDIDRGLHFTLTTPFYPYSFFSLTFISKEKVHNELAIQWKKFEELFGHAPHFIDGHQHIHLHPRIGKIMLSSPLLQNGKTYWRASKNQEIKWKECKSVKKWLFNYRIKSLGKKAGQRHLPLCDQVHGFYNLQKGPDQSVFFPENRQNVNELFFTHPGFIDKLLELRDPITLPRPKEFLLLKNFDGEVKRYNWNFNTKD